MTAVLVLASILGMRFVWRPLSLLGAVAAVMLGSSFFASNGLYPTQIMPARVQAVIHVNPLS